jgi:hypothetical protein
MSISDWSFGFKFKPWDECHSLPGGHGWLCYRVTLTRLLGHFRASLLLRLTTPYAFNSMNHSIRQIVPQISSPRTSGSLLSPLALIATIGIIASALARHVQRYKTGFLSSIL